MPRHKTELTLKQRRFIQEYLIDLNATKAAIRAGYSARNADKIGPQLLGKTSIAAAVAAAELARSQRTQITQDRVLQELAALAFSNISHYTIDAHGAVTLAPDAPGDALSAIASLKRRGATQAGGTETEVKLWDKPASLRMAGLHLGLFTEKHEHTGKDGAALPSLQIILSQDPPQA